MTPLTPEQHRKLVDFYSEYLSGKKYTKGNIEKATNSFEAFLFAFNRNITTVSK